jgi:sRNA-binding protein
MNSKTTAAIAVIRALAEKYPKAIGVKRAQVKPLAVGIHDQLVAAAADMGIDNKATKRALSVYFKGPYYLSALRDPGAMRVALSGEEVEAVSPEHAAHAAERLVEQLKRATARAAAIRAECARAAAKASAKPPIKVAVTDKAAPPPPGPVRLKVPTQTVKARRVMPPPGPAPRSPAVMKPTQPSRPSVEATSPPVPGVRVGLAGLKAAAVARRSTTGLDKEATPADAETSTRA